MCATDQVIQERTFATEQDAKAWFWDKLSDEECRDNFRFAYTDCAWSSAWYDWMMDEGCCGFADYRIMINGREAWIGCNYGH